MAGKQHPIRYPRRSLQRGILRTLGRCLLPPLTRTRVIGRGNFPSAGPLLVVGNHVAAMEVVLMITQAPWQIEMLGPGDIPPPPATDAIAHFYGYTPINRGSADRTALINALGVLGQGGVVGIFPEEGIWHTGPRPAKRGVAWLSHRAQVPILPIGFAGLTGALGAVFRLARPTLTMNVGTLIPPIALPEGKPRKEGLREAATRVMQAVESLVPDQAGPHEADVLDERFAPRVRAADASGTPVAPPDELSLEHGEALSKLFHRPAVLRIFSVGRPHGLLAVCRAHSPLPAARPGSRDHRIQSRPGSSMVSGRRPALGAEGGVLSWIAAGNQKWYNVPVSRHRQNDAGRQRTAAAADSVLASAVTSDKRGWAPLSLGGK